MAAHEAGVDLLAGKLREIFLLVGDGKWQQPSPGVKSRTESSEKTIQFLR
jgi:hypothetical protein